MADSTVTKLFLGRPWRAHAKTAFIRCELPAAIVPQGWHNWGNAANEQTVLYAEYKNTGAGSVTKDRVTWSKQLSDKEAKEYTPENIFSNKSLAVEELLWFRNTGSRSFEWPATKR